MNGRHRQGEVDNDRDRQEGIMSCHRQGEVDNGDVVDVDRDRQEGIMSSIGGQECC